MTSAPPLDDVATAAVDLIGRCGAKTLQIRYSEGDVPDDPVVWLALSAHVVRHPTRLGEQAIEVAAGMTPRDALLRLVAQLVDGGTCQHCKRPSGVTEDFDGEMPVDDLVCWYRYDPELKSFRRGCEDGLGAT